MTLKGGDTLDMAGIKNTDVLTRYDLQKLLPNVPPGEALKNLFFELIKREDSQLIHPDTKSVREVLSTPGNLTHILRLFVNEDSWVDWCTISHAIVLAALERSTDSEFVQLLSAECVEVIFSQQSSKPIKRVGLSLAITLSKVNPSVTNQIIWGVIFKPTVDLMHGTTNSTAVTQLTDVLNLLVLYSLTLELPVLAKRREFFALQTNWIGIAVIYFAVCDYLQRPVLENDEFLKQVKKELGEFIIKTILFVYELDSGQNQENGQLAQFLKSLIIGTKKGTPVFAQLVESGDNSGPDSFQKLHVTNEDLAGGFSSKVTHLFRLISEKLEEGVAKVVFAQLMTVGSSPNQTSKSSGGHDYLGGRPREEGLDLSQYDQAQNYVSLLLLAEFGSSESYLDLLISNIESDENSFTFLKFAIERLQHEIDAWDVRGGGDDPSFPFSASLVQSLEMIETLCTATYEEEVQTGKGVDDPLKKSLIGWKRNEELLPFLRKIQNIKHPFLVQTGIPTKCEELIIFITTRGRGVGANSKAGQSEGSSTLQDILFSLNSGTPSSVGMGLIKLKKLIHARDPGVDTHFDFIMTSLENLLKDEDEYVYNHCINVLVSLTIDHHHKLLPRLIQLYAFTPHGSGQGGGDPEEETGLRYKLKIGEVISKIFTSLGPISVKYVNSVMNAGWSVSSKENVMELRMSAYQVVTALVSQLGHSLDEHILGIWHWAGTKLDQEIDVMVKMSIWGLLEKLLTTVAEVTRRTGVVPPSMATFVKEIYRVSKGGGIGEDERLNDARERIRSLTRVLMEQLLDATSRKLEQVKIL